jgi:mycothiol synthase
MLRPSLRGLPALALPDGCTLRHFRDGDEPAWNALLDAAFERAPGSTSFDREMRPDPEFRPERVLFLEAGGQALATASAWFRPAYGARCGYVHWVGAHPAQRGKKLGHWASLAALHKMAAEGRRAAVLHTDDFRLPALAVYLKLGFRPALSHENQRARWRGVLDELHWPERFDAELSGPLHPFPLED